MSATRVCAKCATRVCADTEDRRSGLACDMVWCSRRRARGGGAASVLQEAVEREREREREREAVARALISPCQRYAKSVFIYCFEAGLA